MSFEIPRYANAHVKEKKENALDEEWIERFSDFANFAAFEHFSGKKEWREKQKDEFYQETVRNPKLDYPKLAKFEFEKREQSLLKLKKDIIDNEQNEVVKKAYRWQINVKIAEIRMMECAFNGDDKKFKKYSSYIYGSPEKEIFAYDLDKIREAIDLKKDSDDVSISFAIKRLEESINFTKESQSIYSKEKLPHKSPIVTFPFKEEQMYSAEAIKEEFEQALREYELEGWRIIIDKDITAITTSQQKKQISIPIKRKVSASKLRALIAHEIGTHALRRENGERSRLSLLGLGLDRYVKGEEGVATFEEQKILGADDFAGFDGHLAIGLAMGLDGKKRDFRDVFNILRDYYFIKSKKKEYDDAWNSAKDSAWNRCVRTFRGTSCKTPGICLTQDIAYREGNIGVWNVISEDKDEEKRFSVGKYDPSNARHIWILEQLGISDEDLETLDK